MARGLRGVVRREVAEIKASRVAQFLIGGVMGCALAVGVAGFGAMVNLDVSHVSAEPDSAIIVDGRPIQTEYLTEYVKYLAGVDCVWFEDGSFVCD